MGLTLSLVNLGFAVLSSAASQCNRAGESAFLDITKAKLGLPEDSWISWPVSAHMQEARTQTYI